MIQALEQSSDLKHGTCRIIKAKFRFTCIFSVRPENDLGMAES